MLSSKTNPPVIAGRYATTVNRMINPESAVNDLQVSFVVSFMALGNSPCRLGIHGLADVGTGRGGAGSGVETPSCKRVFLIVLLPSLVPSCLLDANEFASFRQMNRRLRVLAVPALLILTLVAYLPAVRNGFIWDDNDHFTENP